jgi:AraC-like DNA-binding protein
LSSTAHVLRASSRTVQRRLLEHGTTHREVVDAVRRDFAVRLLEVPGMSITEIAFLLGFSDVSGFTRTFKRWTGRTPALARSRSA